MVHSDPCSFSNPDLFVTKHLTLHWNVDFGAKTLSGYCRLALELQPGKTVTKDDFIVLDSKGLDIRTIFAQTGNDRTLLKFELGEENAAFGRPLRISLHNVPGISDISSLALTIEYTTSPTASALQWLEPSATCGKKYPYLFSQCQAIHARSIVPCQDTPDVKFTYDAEVLVDKPLTALMSAIPKGKTDMADKTRFKFEQKIAIPSYLIAIVVADLVSRSIGPISHVWTEREMIEQAANEFAEIDIMLKDAVALLGDYVWGIYDLLVLPPTFPFGGMENPCLTFVTPTLIAGDRSLTSVIQHEITHSWTGNLVTNCNWEHFWLNEGFTRFIEQKLVGIFQKSEQYRHFKCIDGCRCLKQAIKDFDDINQAHLTKLVVNLKNIDPDDAFSSIPYEKGQALLFYLESILGGVEVFNLYLKAHIENFKFKSIDTDEWKSFLYEYFSDKKSILDSVDWNGWLYNPGMPPVASTFDQTLAQQVSELTNRLLDGDVTDVDPLYVNFSCDLTLELLGQILEKDALSHAKLESINNAYKFSSTRNAEILFKWILIGIKAKWQHIVDLALKFVSSQGRMKFTRPVYRGLYGWEEVRADAISNFLAQRPFMHQTTAMLVAKDLHLSA